MLLGFCKWPGLLLGSTGGTKRFSAWIAGKLDYLPNYIARTASLAALLRGFMNASFGRKQYVVCCLRLSHIPTNLFSQIAIEQALIGCRLHHRSCRSLGLKSQALTNSSSTAYLTPGHPFPLKGATVRIILRISRRTSIARRRFKSQSLRYSHPRSHFDLDDATSINPVTSSAAHQHIRHPHWQSLLNYPSTQLYHTTNGSISVFPPQQQQPCPPDPNDPSLPYAKANQS